MNSRLQREEETFSEKYRLYGQLLYRLALPYVGRSQDAEDVLQEAFIKLLYHAPVFQNAEHEKRWLLRVTINLCKNTRKKSARQCFLEDEDLFAAYDDGDRELFHLLVSLPETYKSVLLLHSVAGYSVKETASLLHISVSAVKMRLNRGRALLQYEWEESYARTDAEKPAE